MEISTLRHTTPSWRKTVNRQTTPGIFRLISSYKSGFYVSKYDTRVKNRNNATEKIQYHIVFCSEWNFFIRTWNKVASWNLVPLAFTDLSRFVNEENFLKFPRHQFIHETQLKLLNDKILRWRAVCLFIVFLQIGGIVPDVTSLRISPYVRKASCNTQREK